MAVLKQSTTYTRAFMVISSSDHISGLTGATVSVNLSKAGGTGAAASGTVSEVDSTHNPGLYKIALTTTDTGTLGDLAYHCTAASGGDPTDFVDQVCANILGDTLPANVTQISGSAVSTSSAQVGVNLVNIAGSAVSTSSAQLGVNTVNIAGQAATLDANNLLEVDVQDWHGTAVSSPATGGVPDVNVKNYNNQTAATDANNLPKVDIEAINASTGAVTNLKTGLNTVATGTCAAGGSTTSVISSALSPSGTASGQFIGRTLIFADNTTTAALQGQACTISASTASATPTFTVSALTNAPASGDTFAIF